MELVKTQALTREMLHRLMNTDGGLAPSSSELYYYSLKKFHRFLESIGQTPDNVSKQSIIDYVNALRAEGLRSTSVNTSIKSLKRLFSAMVERGLLEDNPATGVKFLKEPVDCKSAHNKWFDVPDLRALVAAAGSKKGEVGLRDRAIILMLIYCGVRASELAGLQWKDIIYGSDGSPVELLVRHGKGGRERTIELSSRAMGPVFAYRQHLAEQGVVVDDESYLFLTVPTAKSPTRHPLNRRHLYDMISRTGRRVGLKVSPHKMRHSFATLAYRNGADLLSISRRLGHANLSTTSAIYAHPSSEVLKFVPEVEI